MKKFIYILIIGLTIFFGASWGVNKILNSEAGQPSVKTEVSAAARQPLSQVQGGDYQILLDDQAKVEVAVTPKTLGISQEKNVFTVVFDTHSVELDFDFTKIIALKDDLGNQYQALTWTGNRGWHHVSGDIIFPKINPSAEKVELIVVGVAGVDRKFSWQLK